MFLSAAHMRRETRARARARARSSDQTLPSALIFLRELRAKYVMFALERRGSAETRAQKDARALPSPLPRRSLNVKNVLSYPWVKLSIRHDATARRILIAS